MSQRHETADSVLAKGSPLGVPRAYRMIRIKASSSGKQNRPRQNSAELPAPVWDRCSVTLTRSDICDLCVVSKREKPKADNSWIKNPSWPDLTEEAAIDFRKWYRHVTYSEPPTQWGRLKISAEMVVYS